MLKWIIDKLFEASGTIYQYRKDRGELADQALSAISQALNETFIYYRDVEAGHAIERERQDHLVRLWSAAAIPLRHIDSGLASTCEYKARYWLDPDTWEREQVEELGIDLKSVRDRYHAMLQPESSTLQVPRAVNELK